MKIIINEDRAVMIDMKESMQKVIEFYEEYDHNVDPDTTTSAAYYLF